tara:strand:+ start:2766 stop:3020 length:255 start_codon:yes stop_codon:yes gene_type:complete
MGLFSLLFGSSNNKLQNIKTALNEGALIVDVRSSVEYASGHAMGSINMPLPTLHSGVKKLKNASSVVPLLQKWRKSCFRTKHTQ